MASENQMASELSPLDPALLEWAEYWYPIAWKGLLAAGAVTAVAACATIAFLVLQWRTTSIRENQSEWRTSALELQTAEAKRETSAANERIAVLDNDTERVKAENIALQTVSCPAMLD
jgi:heme/copper-type cytochrome/quinol oxidase subunit 1